jgi:hypothetical protein
MKILLELHNFNDASSTMKCNTWGSRKEVAILSVYGKTLQAHDDGRTRDDGTTALGRHRG